MLEEKIIGLKKQLVTYAGLVETMIEKSIKGLMNKDKNLLKEVFQIDEPKANELEIELDEICTNLIAQYQPKAKDVRTILMIFKMNSDLERIGDLAVDISLSAKFLIDRPQVKPYEDLPIMAQETINMLKNSIESFVNENVGLAKSVCLQDTVVDNLQRKIINDLKEIMNSDPSTIERSMQLIRITNKLERIADHSTNICEDVAFMVNGAVIKHHQDKSMD